MKALVTGVGGQLGQALLAWAPRDVEISAASHRELDIADESAVLDFVRRDRPDVIINAAAYTAVDAAESDSANAFRVNAEGPAILARAALSAKARLLHVSTDYVFGGDSVRPYPPDGRVNPANVYGHSKLMGEQNVRGILGHDALIFRTAWLYGRGGRNFVVTMLRLMQKPDSVRIVADQIGSPTWAGSLARALWHALSIDGFKGTHHWTDAGIASWYDFAIAVQEEALALGLLKLKAPVEPIAMEDYPTPARRPRFSVLDRRETEKALGLRPDHWRVNLRKMLAELKTCAGS